jgi:hypothetical protein
MRKIILASTLLLSSVVADNNLGQKISIAPAVETIEQTQAPLRTRVNPTQQNRPATLQTRVAPKNIKRSFKKDHHRYDKRYSNFDYDRNSYYNDDGYYYGYYDNTGYFYNNIFFDYDSTYTYNDRCHRRGHFRLGYNHRRHYVHHTFNNWNRVHCYRQPNAMVSGHYYDRSYYPRNYYNNNYRSNYGSHYNNHRSPTRMNVTRMNGHTNHNTNRNYNNRNNYSNRNTRVNVTRMNGGNHNTSRNNNHRNNSQRNNSHRSHTRSQTRMTTRHSSGGSRHMGMSR